MQPERLNGFKITGQIEVDGVPMTRTMVVYTKEAYQDVWKRAVDIIINTKNPDIKETLTSYTVMPMQPLAIATSLGEVVTPPVDEVRKPSVVEHPRAPLERVMQNAANAVQEHLRTRERAANGNVPVVSNVVVKVPEGIKEETLESPSVYILQAGETEEEICFS
jgi:hypothetical protein